MKRWLFPVIAVACFSCLWGCSNEAAQTTGSGSGSASSSSGGEGGGPPAALVTCIDTSDTLPRPPSGKLPCEYVPPGLSLPQ